MIKGSAHTHAGSQRKELMRLSCERKAATVLPAKIGRALPVAPRFTSWPGTSLIPEKYLKSFYSPTGASGISLGVERRPEGSGSSSEASKGLY